MHASAKRAAWLRAARRGVAAADMLYTLGGVTAVGTVVYPAIKHSGETVAAQYGNQASVLARGGGATASGASAAVKPKAWDLGFGDRGFYATTPFGSYTAKDGFKGQVGDGIRYDRDNGLRVGPESQPFATYHPDRGVGLAVGQGNGKVDLVYNPRTKGFETKVGDRTIVTGNHADGLHVESGDGNAQLDLDRDGNVKGNIGDLRYEGPRDAQHQVAFGDLIAIPVGGAPRPTRDAVQESAGREQRRERGDGDGNTTTAGDEGDEVEPVR